MNKLENKDKLTTELIPKAVFGIRTDLPQNIKYFAVDKCAYVAGNYIVVFNVKDKTQIFYPANINDGEISCFSIEESRDTILLIIAQKSNERAALNIKFIRKPNLTIEDHKSKRLVLDNNLELNDYFISLDVNISTYAILALSGPKTPALNIIYYDLRTASYKINPPLRLNLNIFYKQVSINTHTNNVISAIGEGGFAIYNYQDEKKKPPLLEFDSKHI